MANKTTLNLDLIARIDAELAVLRGSPLVAESMLSDEAAEIANAMLAEIAGFLGDLTQEMAAAKADVKEAA